jgi:hypothetical protein
VAGHFITSGNAPTISMLTAAGTNAKATITGNDTSGTITITTGDPAKAATQNTPAVVAPTAGDLTQVHFAKAFASMPRAITAPGDKDSAILQVYPDQMGTADFSLGIIGTPQPNTTYTFEYFITQ